LSPADFLSLVAELADPLLEDSDDDEEDDEVLAALSEPDPFDPLAADSFPAATLEPFRLSVR